MGSKTTGRPTVASPPARLALVTVLLAAGMLLLFYSRPAEGLNANPP